VARAVARAVGTVVAMERLVEAVEGFSVVWRIILGVI
jgi:hypothetical protein